MGFGVLRAVGKGETKALARDGCSRPVYTGSQIAPALGRPREVRPRHLVYPEDVLGFYDLESKGVVRKSVPVRMEV